jgi:hypothetical protein
VGVGCVSQCECVSVLCVCFNVYMCVKLIELLKQLQMGREQNSDTLKGENALWEQNMKHILEQMCSLRAKNVHRIHQVSNLESSWHN